MQNYELWQGDCLVEMARIPDGSVDLVVTSPPYDALRQYGGEWQVDLPAVGREILRVLKDGGVAVMVIQDQTKDFKKSLTSFRTIVSWCDSGLNLFECLLYQRSGTPGPWWNQRFRVDHEYMPVFFKGEKPKHFDKSSLAIKSVWGGLTREGGSYRRTDGTVSDPRLMTFAETKCRGTIWDYESGKNRRDSEKSEHPATFPDELPIDHIRCWTNPGDVVLDPFCGSATTGIACLKTGRRFIGIEKDATYHALSQRRLDAAQHDVDGRLFTPAEMEVNA